MRLAASLLLVSVLSACTPPPAQHPGEDTAGVGMRLELHPARTSGQGLTTVRQALQATDAGLAEGTYLCVCPPPAPGDTAYRRTCDCQVEGAPEVPNVCGDGIINVEGGENCDPGHDYCPSGSHCNAGGEVGYDGVVYAACFNCIPNPDGG